MQKPDNRRAAQAAIQAEAMRYIALAEEHYGQKFPCRITFDLKGRSAGQYNFHPLKDTRPRLRFNMGCWALGDEGWRDLYDQTIPHEVAHLIQRQHDDWPKDRRANSSHGRYWKSVMRFFGKEATRCHTLPLPSARKTVKYAATCCAGGGKITLGAKRMNNIRRGLRGYRCPYCKSGLTVDNLKKVFA